MEWLVSCGVLYCYLFYVQVHAVFVLTRVKMLDILAPIAISKWALINPDVFDFELKMIFYIIDYTHR